MLYASDVTTSVGNWVRGNYATGAGGQAMQSNDAGWSNPNEALPAPADYFEARFTPVANKPYRVWMRLRANADSKFNDSIWLQFSGAVDANGAPLWRIGTASGMLVNLESCANCGVSGWGWQTGALVGAAGFDRAISRGDRTDAARADSRGRCPNRSDHPQPDDLFRFAAGNADQRHEHRAEGGGRRAGRPLRARRLRMPDHDVEYRHGESASGCRHHQSGKRRDIHRSRQYRDQATASDSNGSVTRVDFYAGAQLVGTAATAPYSMTWSNASAGTYALTAVALDNGGASGTSSAVSVTVNPAGPPHRRRLRSHSRHLRITIPR